MSSDGSRVSATLEVQAPQPVTNVASRSITAKPPPPVWVQSSKLWVYLVDADALQFHDFGESGRVPTAHSWEPNETKLLGVQTRPTAPTGAESVNEPSAELEVKPPETAAVGTSSDLDGL